MSATLPTTVAVACALLARSLAAAADDAPLVDKTLVVWASPATLEQAGGSALTIDDGSGAFDGIVFGELVFDSTRSGDFGRKVVQRAPLELRPGEPLRLRVFVDRSVVEVCANDRQAICRRVYPTGADSLGIELFAEGGEAAFRKPRAWEMAPSNPF